MARLNQRIKLSREKRKRLATLISRSTLLVDGHKDLVSKASLVENIVRNFWFFHGASDEAEFRRDCNQGDGYGRIF